MKLRPGFRPATDEERKKLGIPPAYKDPLVAVDENADLIAMATIVTPSGKTKPFYKYSKAHIERQAREKFLRVALLAHEVDAIDAKILKDCQSDTGARGLAISARLVLLTGMRAGNPPQGQGESFGACSLLTSHATVRGNAVRFQFIGKKGVPQDVTVQDEVIARHVGLRKAGGCARIFDHEANALLRYMKKIGVDKTHDLRTLRAMLMAKELLRAVPEKPTTKKGAKLIRKFVSTEIAKVLGNNASQVVKSYVSESIWPGLEEEE